MTKLLLVRQNNVMFLTGGNIHALGISCLKLNITSKKQIAMDKSTQFSKIKKQIF